MGGFRFSRMPPAVARRAALAAGILAALASVFVVVGILLPGTVEVTRSVEIAAPPEQVFPLLNSLDAWTEWTPWGDVQSRIEGPAAGAGARRVWDDPIIGAGSLSITRLATVHVGGLHGRGRGGSAAFRRQHHRRGARGRVARHLDRARRSGLEPLDGAGPRSTWRRPRGHSCRTASSVCGNMWRRADKAATAGRAPSRSAHRSSASDASPEEAHPWHRPDANPTAAASWPARLAAHRRDSRSSSFRGRRSSQIDRRIDPPIRKFAA